ncbi:MAG: carboxypeptidase regulatory-like domain-containing protein, partial [Acidobacteriota bacterium]
MITQFVVPGRRVQVVFVGLTLLLLFLSADLCHAQFLDQGAITGVVQDQSGSVIRGAAVTLTDPDTGQILHATTNGAGVYEFSPLTLGHYQISISAQGFETVKQENISLQLGERISIPITLRPGAVSQTVTVTGAPSLLRTADSAVSQVVDTNQINDLPLNGRNAMFAAQFTAGSAPASTSRDKTGDFDANGLRPEQNDYILDGMDNMALSADGLGGSSFLVNPPPDALADFKVSTSDYGAEFGHSAGAVLDESIKSGTNQIHGDVWEYWRNNILDAKDFDALTIPEFRENEFGATLGLPIIKNKLFFFGDIQEIRIAAAQPYTQTVPTLTERKGDFSDLLSPSLTGQSKPIMLYAPNSGTTLQQCNGAQNVFCSNQIDPVALNILNLYPLPNANGLDTYDNNVQNLSQPQDTFQYDVRVDWTISPKDQAFVRFSDFNQMENFAGPLGPILDGSCGEGSDCVSGLQLDFGNNFVISETHMFTPSLINQFRFGFDYGHFDTYQLNYTQDIATTLGLGNMPFGAGFTNNGGLPTLEIGSVAQAGTHQYRPEEERANVFQIMDNVTKTWGKQTFNIGLDLENGRSYTLEPPVSHGTYGFTGFFTSHYGAAFTGNGVADFLADQMHDGSVGPSAAFNDSQWHSSGYAQDDWRASQNLTL